MINLCYLFIDDGRKDDDTPTHGGNGGNDVCHFDFLFDGKTFSKCTTEGHDKEWCATTENFDKDGLWGFCGDGMIIFISFMLPSTIIVSIRMFR